MTGRKRFNRSKSLPSLNLPGPTESPRQNTDKPEEEKETDADKENEKGNNN